MKKLNFISLIALLFVACSTENKNESVDNVTINLQFNSNIEAIGTTAESSDECDIRYIVRAYNLEADKVTDLAAENIFYKRGADKSLNSQSSISLAAGKYKIFVWTDYVDKDSTEDKFYSTELFPQISICEEGNNLLIGNSDYRDAFRGYATIEVGKSKVNTTINMARPLAKVALIANDLEAFTAANPTVELSECYAVIRYAAFLPCSFNLLTDKMVDSTTNAMFRSQIVALDQNSALLGFDYIFVNPNKESSINIAVSIFDKNDNMLAQVPNLTVSLQQNKLSKISGNFLTGKAE